MRYMVGIDLGGTNIVCGLVNEQYELIDKVKRPTETELGEEHVLQKMASMVDELLVKNGIERSSLIAVGAGCPGFIDPIRGMTLFAANLKWTDVEVSKRLGELVGVPVFIDNDVRMYVYGEAMSGAGRDGKVVLGVTIGTGMSAATVANGELYYGNRFMAGEIGHVAMDGETTPCGCGLIGCVETVVSATGLVRQAREALEAGRSSILREAYEAGSLTAALISDAYDQGDELAQSIMQHTGTVLGKALAYAITAYSPDILVIGGGGSLAGERLFVPVRETLKRHVYHGYLEQLDIRQGELIDDGGVIGSAAFARTRWSQLNAASSQATVSTSATVRDCHV
ncbi:ROK family protein [Paenibacillus arenosi]|uniref:ROK family protein n=1 Tax=Paenibacillus arenosi TaxID=2774142 RepID=A0ABR9AW95_9BACL|nr:ROK family protein [Paenibacillus arenosi]